MAFDTRRQREVILGDHGDVWERDRFGLLHRPVVDNQPAPSYRAFGHMVYDPARSRVLLYGGSPVGGPFLDDTWSWDGGRWRAVPSAARPTGRGRAVMVYDEVRDRAVLFGGDTSYSSTIRRQDTWELDGDQWTQVAGSGPVGFDNIAAYDHQRGAVVMARMASSQSQALPVTLWRWTGAAWVAIPATGAPLSRSGVAFAYDPVRQALVMAGGRLTAPAWGLSDEIWEERSGTWSLAGSEPAIARSAAKAWFDPDRGGVAISGGVDAFSFPFTSTWLWDGAQAVPAHDEARPRQRGNYALWYDSWRDRLTMFGGYDVSAVLQSDETWSWNGNEWELLAPAVRPSRRWLAASTFDSVRGVGVLFGGESGNTEVGDLWEFDGTNWQQRNPPGPSPSPRRLAAFAFDSGRARAVLFGGFDAANTALTDTWEWDGAAWTNPQPTNAPSPGVLALGYDSARGRTVSFGGAGLETWEWDGSNWQQVVTSTAPGPANVLTQASMAYDDGAQRLVLVVNNTANFTSRRELWSYDGVDWTLLHDEFAANNFPRVTYDSTRQRLLLNESKFVRVWSSTPAAVSAFGSGCGSPEPRLALRTRPAIGSEQFGFEVLTDPLGVCGIVVSGSTGSTVLVPGCTLDVGPQLVGLLAFADAEGLAVKLLELPDDPVFRGLTFYAQAGTIDPLTSAVGLTPGVAFVIGD